MSRPTIHLWAPLALGLAMACSSGPLPAPQDGREATPSGANGQPQDQADRLAQGADGQPPMAPGRATAGGPRSATRGGPAHPPYQAPSYATLDGLSHREVVVGTSPWALPATLTLPRRGQPCPAVVLVHGSGPADQDGTLGPNKPLADLALGLASRGIGALRYTKRTRQHGPAVARELGERLTLDEETVNDAVAAARTLRAAAGVDPRRVFVLGHSLGGTAIPRIAKATPEARGYIILAGSTLPLEDTLVRQMRYLSLLDGRLSEAERRILAKLESQAARVKALHADSRVAPGDLPLDIPVPYWLDLARHPPAHEVAPETRPILVLQGDRDYQVTIDDFAGWRRALAGKPNGTLKRYGGLNHLFMAGSGPSSPTEYLVAGHVAVEVIEDVAQWIASH